MTWRPLNAIAIAVALVAVASGLTYRASRSDRESLLAAFAEDRLQRLRDEVRDLEVELSEIDKHLDITSRLLAGLNSPKIEKEELETVLAVVRSFEMMAVYDAKGHQRALALDTVTPPASGGAAFLDDLAKTAEEAMVHRRKVISRTLRGSKEECYRAFAAPIHRKGRTDAVVLLVSLRRQLDRVRGGVGGSDARLVISERDGGPPLILDDDDPPGHSFVISSEDVAALLRHMSRQEFGTSLLGRPRSTLFGFSPDGVSAFGVVETGFGAPWRIAVVSPTKLLRAQERSIVLRTFALGGIIVLALAVLATYFVVAARRAISIRERLRSAEEIAHHSEKAEKILESVPVGVVALDGRGRVAAMNPTALARMPRTTLGLRIESAFPAALPSATRTVEELLARARSSGAVQSIVGQPLALWGIGTYFVVHAVPLAHPVQDVHMLVVFEDVTELRALASQLLRAEKLATVGVLAAGFAHEVGTPLAVIRGRAEMLASKLLPGTSDARDATIMVGEIDRISRTIRELLDFSRASRAPAVAAVRLENVASNVVELLAFEARNRGVALEADVAAGVPALAADGDQLKQVLVNLMMNALDACAAGGRVRLDGRADPRRARAVIEVADNGSGIPDKDRHRVFDPFFTTKKRGKGTGLGLTIVAQIVRDHGGEIDLESTVGRGTRVVVTWPLASAEMERTDGQQEARTPSPGGR